MIRIPSVGSPGSMTVGCAWLSADGGLDGGAGRDWDCIGRGWAGAGWADACCVDAGWADAGWA
jgi:hypothetical protein